MAEILIVIMLLMANWQARSTNYLQSHVRLCLALRIHSTQTSTISLLDQASNITQPQPSITNHTIFNKTFHIKRDDLLNVNGITGNKIRKLSFFKQFLPEYSSHVKIPRIIASYGGYQSNAMSAIAQLVAQIPSSKFLYFTKNLSKELLAKPIGNLKSALSNGMHIVTLNRSTYATLPDLPKLSSSFPHHVVSPALMHELNSQPHPFSQSQSNVEFQALPLEFRRSNNKNEFITDDGALGTVDDAARGDNRRFAENWYSTSTTQLVQNELNYLWIPQGVSMLEAEIGIRELVCELLDFIRKKQSERDQGDQKENGRNGLSNKRVSQNSESTGGHCRVYPHPTKLGLGTEINQHSPAITGSWRVIFASGTGTMALFAARQLHLLRQSRTQLTEYNQSNLSTLLSNKTKYSVFDAMDTSTVQNTRDVDTLASTKADSYSDLADMDIQVVAVPVIDYITLYNDMKKLDLQTGNYNIFPRILHEPTAPTRNFGQTYEDYLRIHQYVESITGIKFDLIYAPRAFELLLYNHCRLTGVELDAHGVDLIGNKDSTRQGESTVASKRRRVPKHAIRTSTLPSSRSEVATGELKSKCLLQLADSINSKIASIENSNGTSTTDYSVTTEFDASSQCRNTASIDTALGSDVFDPDYNIWCDADGKSCNIIFYHCGGVEGNESQMSRYAKNKKL